ncbi:MAG: DNA polymerase III subunit delta [Pseudomonadota bacterium]
MKCFPDRLESTLERGLAPVFLVAGPELLLVEEACDAIRARAREEQIAERVVLEADGRFQWDELTSAGESLSLFATRRLIELRLPSGKPGREGGAALREWAASSSDDVLLIKCQAWEIKSESTAWFKALDQVGVFVPCWAIKPHQLPQWIERRLASRGLRADQSAARFLAERLEGNLLAAAQEIERLALFYGRGASLDIETLKTAVADSARFDSFRLTELTFSGQAGAAVRCIRGLVETDTPQPMIVFALARELQMIESVHALSRSMSVQQAVTKLGVWKSRQQALAQAASRVDPGVVRQALTRLSDLDIQSKSNAKPLFWLNLERLCVALALNDAGRLAA